MKLRTKTRALGAALLATLAGCATYQPAPLPARADLKPSTTVPAAVLSRGGPQRRLIDPAAPLDEDAVVAIAVLNNPDLKAARARSGVANAQIFEAGLLPDPQVSVGLSRSSEHRGYDLGIVQELRSILTQGARRAAARAHARQVNLEILWQESQVAEKARELFIRLAAGPKLQELLAADRSVLAKRYASDRSAMLQNAATVTTVTADATAVADVDGQLRELALQTNDANHALHALLGIQPSAPISLGALPPAAIPTQPQFSDIVAAMPKRRADLLALQAGYESQEASLRAAVLGQFPAVSIGIDRARSAEEGVNTAGLSISVGLPVFDRNRGRIAIERATREQLQAEYRARLDQAVNDADRLWQAMRLLDVQQRHLDAQIATMGKSAKAADREFWAGNLTVDQYADLRPNLYLQQLNALRLRITLDQTEAAFALLTGERAAGN